MWKVVIILLFKFCAEILTKQVTGRYECGDHGKFEYCLEGVPGCVIGCHCHPGYYFDTDTKVCEPNNKLAQNYKKHNADDGPTRKQLDLNAWPTRVNNDEFTTVANINDKLNDDLGDWLYNQFFKTIENQVLNETTNNSDTPSRRTNNIDPVPSRRSKRRKQKKKNKKRKSRRNRRRKLLKIPADDPMWETSGESDSDSSDSSNSRSVDSSESSSASNEKKNKNTKKSHNNPSDHDHSKFLIIKKQPKPPLPSFIFMPNVDTPYYPPVGLAAAAAMPMFPMVPVPPVMPYPAPGGAMPPPGPGGPGTVPGGGPIPGPGGIDGIPTVTEQSDATGTSAASELTDLPTKSNDENKDGALDTEKPNTGEVLESMDLTRMGVRLRKKMKKARLERLQHPQQVPTQLSRRHHKVQKGSLPLPIQTNLPVPTLNEANIGSNILQPPIQVIQAPTKPRQRFKTQPNWENNPDKFESLKYLSQLIRKTEQPEKTASTLRGDISNIILQRIENQLKRLQDPPVEKLKRNNQLLSKISSHLTKMLTPKKEELKPSRRMFDNEEINTDESDAYYANLGRQIAAVIKDVNPSPKSNTQPPSPPIFNENSYSSRSFWERSVRSPTTTQKTVSELTTKQSLYDLENKVKNAATDVPFLSLSEIENIINMVNGDDDDKGNNAIHVQVSHTEHNTTRIVKLNLFPKNLHNSVELNKEKRQLHQHIPRSIVPNSPTKYSIFKPAEVPKPINKSIHNYINKTSESLSYAGHPYPNLKNKHHAHHHRHHHDHSHLMPYELEHHHNKEDKYKNRYNLKEKSGDDQHQNDIRLDNEIKIDGKYIAQQQKKNKLKASEYPLKKSDLEPKLNPETNESLNIKNKDTETPNGYNIITDYTNNFSNNGSNGNNSKNANILNNVQNTDEFDNANERANTPIQISHSNPSAILIREPYVHPDLNRHSKFYEDSYAKEGPVKSSISGQHFKRNREVEHIFSTSDSRNRFKGVPHEQSEPLYPNTNLKAGNFNVNPNDSSKLPNAFPNPHVESSNPEYSNKYPEVSLKADNNPMVNFEVPADFELSTSNRSQHEVGHLNRRFGAIPSINHENRKRIVATNGTDRYRNHLPEPYTDITYNIASNRQLYPGYPTIYKGSKAENKPIWAGFSGRGLRPYKKPHTPIFHSALFFDDFN